MKTQIMKNIFFSGALLLCFIAVANAQISTKVYNKNGYKLTITNYDATLDTAELTRLVKTFYIVYPELAKEYNPTTLKDVKMAVDTSYKGVAATADGKVTIASSWLHKRPEDIDVVTHEVMHIVQDYGESVGPGWLTEGIADYARNKFGVNNTAAKWTLPDYKPTQNYDNAYRITARFLVWIEKKAKPGIVKELDSQMRKHTYTDAAWKTLTGKTVDELWKEYAANPAI
jgi:sulfur carrier protein ThiS